MCSAVIALLLVVISAKKEPITLPSMADTGKNCSTVGGYDHVAPAKSKFLGSNFLISPDEGLLFCQIEKVGSFMFSEFLMLLQNQTLDHRIRGKENVMWSRNHPSEYNIDIDHEYKSYLTSGNWTSLVFLQDPVARLLSVYNEKCIHANWGGNCLYHYKQPVTFSGFVDTLVSCGHKGHPLYTPQSHRCGGLLDTIVNFDFVAMLEEQKKTLAVMKAVAQNLNHPIEALNIVNNHFGNDEYVDSHNTSTMRHDGHNNTGFSDISKATKDKINEFYKEDITLIALVHEKKKLHTATAIPPLPRTNSIEPDMEPDIEPSVAPSTRKKKKKKLRDFLLSLKSS
jgi:hypothetical protein